MWRFSRFALLAPVTVALAACTSAPATTPAGAEASGTSSAGASADTMPATPGSASGSATAAASSPGGAPATTAPGAPAHGANVYAAAVGPPSGVAATAKQLVYVPNQRSGSVDVIDPATYRVLRSFPVAKSPEHVVPSWDMKVLWVNSDVGNALTPIDPRTGTSGKPVAVADPYNLYFTPDGTYALVMAERLRRIDVRDARTMRLLRSLPVPCKGVNHADFTADGSSFVASCEFDGRLLVVDRDATKVRKVINLNGVRTPGGTTPMEARMHGGPKASLEPGASSMPQDVRLTPDGSRFLVADMLRNGVWVIDAGNMTQRGFLPTGLGAHGIYPSRDAARIFVSNRDAGSISVLDASTLKTTATWRIPGGGSPDMGGVSADGTKLWLSGRNHNTVYVFDTATGKVLRRISVGQGPHGLCVWPQPGRYSLGHTGNTR